MSMEKSSIVSMKEVGARLSGRQRSLGINVETLLRETRISRDSWYRWSTGKTEGACIQTTKLGAFLGFQPDELYMVQPPGLPEVPGFTERDYGALREIALALSDMVQAGGEDWGKRPTELAFEMILGVRDTVVANLTRMREKAEPVLPPGGSQRVHGDVLILDAPPQERPDEEDERVRAEKVSEDAAEFGSGRKNKPKK